MHAYSVNSEERKTVPFFLAGLSILIVLLLKDIPNMPGWMPIPSVFALYGILYKAFDKFLWKWRPLQICGIVDTPNLNGKWKMLSRSSMNKYIIEYEGTLNIDQTWTKISIYLDGERAFSKSLMAGFDIRTSGSFSLKWEYISQKKPEFSEEDYLHYGLTRVLNNSECGYKLLRGDYFTDRSRHYYGPVTLIKKEKA